jgi:hypothetical protein
MKATREGPRWIERCWDGPMANDRTTRIRFAVWDAMEFAAKLAGRYSKRAKAAILADVKKDQALFSSDGHRLNERPPG